MARYYNGWRQSPEDLHELKELCQDLIDAGIEEWYWNSYSCINTSVPKGHPLDDSMDDEPGYASVVGIYQAPQHEGHGDELHHPLPRAIALLVEKCDPKFVLALIEEIEAS